MGSPCGHLRRQPGGEALAVDGEVLHLTFHEEAVGEVAQRTEGLLVLDVIEERRAGLHAADVVVPVEVGDLGIRRLPYAACVTLQQPPLNNQRHRIDLKGMIWPR